MMRPQGTGNPPSVMAIATIIAAVITAAGGIYAAYVTASANRQREQAPAQVEGSPPESEAKKGEIETPSSPGPGGTPQELGPAEPPVLAQTPSNRLFETESYRVTAEEVNKSGNTVRVTMVLEATGERGLEFHAGGWYLLDENGERWSELSSDSPSIRLERERALAAGLLAPFRDKIHLVSGTRVKDSLVFSTTGSGQGANFTLIGVESDPQPRREIVLRGLVAGDG